MAHSPTTMQWCPAGQQRCWTCFLRPTCPLACGWMLGCPLPLHLAISVPENQDAVRRILCKWLKDVMAADAAAHLTAIVPKERGKCAQAFPLCAKMKKKRGMQPLHVACGVFYFFVPEAVKLLIDADPGVLQLGDANLETPLHSTCTITSGVDPAVIVQALLYQSPRAVRMADRSWRLPR